LNFPGYSEQQQPPPAPYVVPDEAPPNPDAPWPSTQELPYHSPTESGFGGNPKTATDFERAAYQDMRRFHRLGRMDAAVSAVTFGGDNIRMNYALLGLLIGGLVMFAFWWFITE
jgi:hypothetical protein